MSNMKSVLAGMCVRAWARSLVVAMLFLAVVLVELAAESASAKPHSKGLLSAAFDEFVFRRLTVMRPEEIARQTGQIWALVRIQPKPYVQKPSGELREGANPGEWHFLAYPIDNSRGGIVAIVSALTGQPDLKVYDYSFIPPMGGEQHRHPPERWTLPRGRPLHLPGRPGEERYRRVFPALLDT
jgi:hypothetical protein